MSVVLDAESTVYPRELLRDCESALLAFCSGRMGAADGHWVREAGLHDVVCVDWDSETLEPFAQSYPDEWRYVLRDAFEYAQHCTRTFDLVSADMPSQYELRMLGSMALWCSLACKYVTATVMKSCLTGGGWWIPEGWKIRELVKRNEHEDGRVWMWLVMEAR
jgi:hypothetical protein